MLALRKQEFLAPKTAASRISSDPLGMREFFRLLSHAARDLAFEYEAGTFVPVWGLCFSGGQPYSIGGHVLARCGIPPDCGETSLSRLVASMLLDALYSPIRQAETWTEVKPTLPGEDDLRKTMILKYLREAADTAGRMAAA